MIGKQSVSKNTSIVSIINIQDRELREFQDGLRLRFLTM